MSMFQKMMSPLLKLYTDSLSKKSISQKSGSLKIKGLKNKVEIIRDQWGVAHIYANNQEDLLFAQGFFHAQERLFQMELTLRAACGRASEAIGKDMLETDRITRTFGFRRTAIEDEKLLIQEKDSFPIIQAYAKGINTYVDQCGKNLPTGFKLLKIQSNKWTALDVITLARFMNFMMSYGWLAEMEKLRIADIVGIDRAAELDIHPPKNNPLVLPNGIETYTYSHDGKLNVFKGPHLRPTGGSNNWCVAPNRMVDQSAYLCNDPHLPIGLPAIWIENHLVCPDFEVTGVSVPGLPMTLIGHNQHIAWGATLAFLDLADTFIEEFTDASMKQYHFKEGLRDTQIIEEVIHVKGQKEAHVEKIYVTHHGPIISDVLNFPNKKLSLQSVPLQPGKEILGFYQLNKAKDWDDFVNALRLIKSPALSIVYSDTKGNIGYWATGQVPNRTPNDLGFYPKEGKSGIYDWDQMVPFEEMPHAFNPPKGYLATCNNKIVDDNYPYNLGNLFMNGYRRKRIEMLFNEKEKMSVDDFKKFHLDVLCLPGLEMSKRYKEIKSTDALVNKAIDVLLNWDGYLTLETTGGSIYQVVKRSMIELVIKSKLDQLGMERFVGGSPNEFAIPLSEFYGHDTVTLFRILDNPDSWWNKEAGGTAIILLNAIEEAVRFLRNKFGENIDTWKWGELHKLHLTHILGEQPITAPIFNLGKIPVIGDTDTLCQMGFIPDKPYEGKIIGPSYRQIIKMNDFDASYTCMPPGQSMNYSDPHYSDQLSMWLNGEYKPMLWSKSEVLKFSKNKLILEI